MAELFQEGKWTTSLTFLGYQRRADNAVIFIILSEARILECHARDELHQEQNREVHNTNRNLGSNEQSLGNVQAISIIVTKHLCRAGGKAIGDTARSSCMF